MGIFRQPIIGSRDDTRNCTVWQKLFPSRLESHRRQISDQLLRLPTRAVSAFSQKGAVVELCDMDSAIVSSPSYPIGTEGLISCVAFAIIDAHTGVHSVGHISPLTIINDLLAFLGEFNPSSSAFLRSGPINYNLLPRVYDVFLRAQFSDIRIVESGPTLVAFEGNVFELPVDQQTRMGYTLTDSSFRFFGPRSTQIF